MPCLKSHGCQPNCMFWCFVHVSGVVGPFFHRSNCEWGQLPGHAANVRHPCNFWHPRPSVPTGWSPSTLAQACQGLPWRHSKGCLDWTWRPYCLAHQVSRSHQIRWENMALGTDFAHNFCAWDRSGKARCSACFIYSDDDALHRKVWSTLKNKLMSPKTATLVIIFLLRKLLMYIHFWLRRSIFIYAPLDIVFHLLDTYWVM